MTYTIEQLALKLAMERNPTLPIDRQLANADKYLKWLRENRGL